MHHYTINIITVILGAAAFCYGGYRGYLYAVQKEQVRWEAAYRNGDTERDDQ